MTKEELIRNLRYTMKKHKNDKVDTFGTDIHQLCKDVLNVLEQDSQQALSSEPQGDLISRDAVLNLYEEYRPRLATNVCEFGDALEQIPPVEQTEWISVKDRLPELGQMVLVTYADGDVETNERMALKNLEVWKYGNNVVAWMPLPSPYKGE